jgi:3-oxoacyl-[acyl-carrier-protein] synthase-3
MGILALGAHVPDHVIDNEMVARWAGTTPDWIVERTGVRERRYADAATSTAELAAAAARDLLARSGIGLDEVGGLVCATSTPDQRIPATAAAVQDLLGLSGVAAFDVDAVCTGFLCALVAGGGLLSWTGRPVLLVAADRYSTVVDRTDRRTVSLFGDGAGAALLGEVPAGYGVEAVELVGHGELRELVEVSDGPLRMRGRDITSYALDVLPRAVDAVLARSGATMSDVDRVVLHQGNVRLVEKLAAALGAPPEQVEVTADRLGNTACASIPITLCAARPLERGQRVLLAAVGGGMTAGAALVRWY